MPKRGLIAGCCLALGMFSAARSQAQITSLADDIIIISKGVQTQEQQRTDQHLGGDIGGTMNTLGASPGSGAMPIAQSNQAPEPAIAARIAMYCRLPPAAVSAALSSSFAFSRHKRCRLRRPSF